MAKNKRYFGKHNLPVAFVDPVIALKESEEFQDVMPGKYGQHENRDKVDKGQVEYEFRWYSEGERKAKLVMYARGFSMDLYVTRRKDDSLPIESLLERLAGEVERSPKRINNYNEGSFEND